MIKENKYNDLRFITFAIVDYWVKDDTNKLGFRPVYFKHISN